MEIIKGKKSKEKEIGIPFKPMELVNDDQAVIAAKIFTPTTTIGLNDEVTKPIDKIQLLRFDDLEGKEIYWHSTAHIFAQAVLELYPKAKITIGPAIENGFYYDVDCEPFKSDDIEKIEKKMQEIIKQNLPIEKIQMSYDEALKTFKDNEYKIEMINEIKDKGEELTFYKQGNFIDLCRGPHVPSTGYIKAVKLLKSSSAYWKGDAKNKQLQRIYGISFPSEKELKFYLKDLEEAEKRDHNKLGRQLGIFCTNDAIGKGLPLLMPKGATLKRILRRFIEDEELKRGYVYTETPVLAKTELYKISGHYEHYKDDMFIFDVNGEEVALRPMTCPHQFMIYKNESHSYRDLPIRYAEVANLFRKEKSGELHGLIRNWQFTLADAHIICRDDQVEKEFEDVLKLVQYVMKCLGFEDYWYRFSKWDPTNKKKYIDNPDAWNSSQKIMKQILDKLKLEYIEADDEAAFYGPKLDVQMKNVYGKEDTLFTIQLDFALPERFEMTYEGEDGQKHIPYVIHRSSLGAFERTMALLIEKYAGKFPLWLSPVQVKIIPVSDGFMGYAEELNDKLKDHGIRTELDTKSESVSKKIRNAQLEKVNYMLVIGDKEKESGNLSIRTRNNKIISDIPLNDFIQTIKKENDTKSLEPSYK